VLSAEMERGGVLGEEGEDLGLGVAVVEPDCAFVGWVGGDVG
jgi:hypothetical protein